MITNNDYENSVLVTEFIKEIKVRTAESKNISDVNFKPTVKGYEISFSDGDKCIRVSAEVKGFFTKKLLIKKFVDSKEAAICKTCTKEEISACTAQLLSE